MVSPPSPNPSASARLEALAGLRAALSAGHRAASPEAFTLAEASVIRTGFGELDAALGGGFPRGVIATLEGPPGSGRSTVAARLLAGATASGGLAALIELPGGADGSLYPPSLAVAGVDLDRLLIVPAADTAGVARAADVVLRAAAFGVVAIPTIALTAPAWTRLSSLAHRANALLVALGETAGDELRYFASVRVRLRASGVRWAGAPGLFCALAGAAAEATVLKHKRAAPGKRAHIPSVTFERGGAPLVALVERAFDDAAAPAARDRFAVASTRSLAG